ncbi:MAG: hypothetical protein Q8M26_14935 [Pseudolabrys sp.]|nr:hypothetical protein [Pseudolabrys sp.]
MMAAVDAARARATVDEITDALPRTNVLNAANRALDLPEGRQSNQ